MLVAVRRAAQSEPRQGGFSTIEIVVILLVVGIALAVSIPAVGNWLREYRLGIAAQQVADGLQATKMQAVAKTRRRELIFDVQGNRLGQEGATLVSLPPGVAFGRGAAPGPAAGGTAGVQRGPAGLRLRTASAA